MELGHWLFLHSLSQAEVKTEFHHCMSRIMLVGIQALFFFSHLKNKKGGEKGKHIIHKHRLGDALNPHPAAFHSPSSILWVSGCFIYCP